MSPRTCAALLLLVGCGLLPSCVELDRFGGRSPDEATVAEEEWVWSPAPLSGCDPDALWEHAKEVVTTSGYEIDDTRTRYDERVIVTRWKTALSPLRYEGRRSRTWIQFREPAAGAWITGVAVQTQRNIDIDHPSEAARAKWEDMPAESTKAQVTLHLIESGFREPPAGAR